jgi:hypothetical protein
MKSRCAIAFASVLFIFSGCASSTQQTKPGAIKDGVAMAKKEKASGSKVTCEMERTVGTMIPQRVCRDDEEVEQSRVEMQNKLNATPSVQSERGQ